MDRDSSYAWRLVRYYIRVCILLVAHLVLTVFYLQRYRVYIEEYPSREISFVGIEKRARRGSPRKLVLSLCGRSEDYHHATRVKKSKARPVRTCETATDAHIVRA